MRPRLDREPIARVTKLVFRSPKDLKSSHTACYLLLQLSDGRAKFGRQVRCSHFVPLTTWHPLEVLHFPLRSRGQWTRKVQLQGDAFTKHIERVGTGYHLKSYEALREGRIEAQYESLVVDDAALQRGIADGTLVVDTRLRDAFHTLRAGGRLAFPAPTDAEDVAYAVETAVLDEAYVVRAQRRLDALEQRLESLEAE